MRMSCEHACNLQALGVDSELLINQDDKGTNRKQTKGGPFATNIGTVSMLLVQQMYNREARTPWGRFCINTQQRYNDRTTGFLALDVFEDVNIATSSTDSISTFMH